MKLYVLPHQVIQINFWVTNLHKKEGSEHIMKRITACCCVCFDSNQSYKCH